MFLNLECILLCVLIAWHSIDTYPDVITRTVVPPAGPSVVRINSISEFSCLPNIKNLPAPAFVYANDYVNSSNVGKVSACQFNTDTGITPDCNITSLVCHINFLLVSEITQYTLKGLGTKTVYCIELHSTSLIHSLYRITQATALFF